MADTHLWRFFGQDMTISCYSQEQLLPLVERTLKGDVTFEPVMKGDLRFRVRLDGEVAGFVERV